MAFFWLVLMALTFRVFVETTRRSLRVKPLGGVRNTAKYCLWVQGCLGFRVRSIPFLKICGCRYAEVGDASPLAYFGTSDFRCTCYDACDQAVCTTCRSLLNIVFRPGSCSKQDNFSDWSGQELCLTLQSSTLT